MRLILGGSELCIRDGHRPEFRENVTKDRRSALSQYTAVKDALRDRERIRMKGNGKAKANDKKVNAKAKKVSSGGK